MYGSNTMMWRQMILSPGPDEEVNIFEKNASRLTIPMNFGTRSQGNQSILGERLQIGDAPAQDERVNVVRALVRVDSLQVHHVPDYISGC